MSPLQSNIQLFAVVSEVALTEDVCHCGLISGVTYVFSLALALARL
jgi:hypothetical protein